MSNNKNVPVLGSSSPLVLVTIVIGIMSDSRRPWDGAEGEGGLFDIGGAFLLTLFDRSGLLSQERRNGPTNVNWMTLSDHKHRDHIIMFLNKSDPGACLRLDSLWPQQSSFGS